MPDVRHLHRRGGAGAQRELPRRSWTCRTGWRWRRWPATGPGWRPCSGRARSARSGTVGGGHARTTTPCPTSTGRQRHQDAPRPQPLVRRALRRAAGELAPSRRVRAPCSTTPWWCGATRPTPATTPPRRRSRCWLAAAGGKLKSGRLPGSAGLRLVAAADHLRPRDGGHQPDEVRRPGDERRRHPHAAELAAPHLSLSLSISLSISPLARGEGPVEKALLGNPGFVGGPRLAGHGLLTLPTQPTRPCPARRGFWCPQSLARAGWAGWVGWVG